MTMDKDRIKKVDVESYSLHYWEFDKYRGKKVPDVGCGPGWLTVQYAKAGADVSAVDLTPDAVARAKKFPERLARVKNPAPTSYAGVRPAGQGAST